MQVPATRRTVLGAGLAAIAAPAMAATPTAPSPPATFGIGALFPFSGPLSQLGDESFRGLDLAVDERNAAGGLLGRQIALLRGDAADQPQATAEAKRLTEKSGARTMFGSYASAVSFAASVVTELAGVPFFELDALADAITERGLKLLFRSGPLASATGVLAVDTVADLLAPHWQSEPAKLSVAILHEDGIAGTALANAQETRCRERGFVHAERIAYGIGILDFAPTVERLRANNVDVVLHAAQINDVLLFHRAMQQAGWRPRMVIGANGGYSLNDTAQMLGAAFQGVMSVGVTPYRVSDVVAPGVGELAAAYQRKYGAPPRSGHSLVAFAGARIFFDIIQRAGGLERDKLRAAVLATDIPPGATVGGFGAKFDERGQNMRAMPYLAQWQGGALVTVAPMEAAMAQAVPVLGG
ncbi:MAG: ABC transporter substrate-binding protein [Alphaproteobacteria bacterium]|nr:ABC transporter substrate-binding protein [Alphaproteobacteria bacterium]